MQVRYLDVDPCSSARLLTVGYTSADAEDVLAQNLRRKKASPIAVDRAAPS